MSYISIENSMKGKTALITGGTSGIGKVCVKMFCEVGVDVVTIGRRAHLGKALEEEINAQGKGKMVFYECDVRNSDRIRQVIELTVEQFGKLDILVNCAGYFPSQKQIDECSEEELKDIIDTNLFAYLVACKYAIPYLRSTRGNIVNIGSVHGTTSVQGYVGYDATKGAIDSITRTLAIDEARNGVRANNVKPGLIATEMFEKTTAQQKDKEGFIKWNNDIQWLGRAGKAEEVAYAVLFLASEQASFITGAELMVSGGYELGEGLKVYNPFLKWNESIKKGSVKNVMKTTI